MRFEFATATRILFGESTLKEVGPAAIEMGRKALAPVRAQQSLLHSSIVTPRRNGALTSRLKN